ncbi:MAG: M23 family metallopeptidase [Saprospiraceae bacterium]|nr:M23 family metallopeptidase [Saprospiraceae bacterium]
MSKFLSILGGFIIFLWYINFDAEAYLLKKQQEQASETSTAPPQSQSFAFPLKDKSLQDVISGYGDARNGGKRLHEGIDIPAPKGTPVFAVADGQIIKVANKGNGGKQVWLKVDSLRFFYAHLDDWKVKTGQFVKQGDIIGTVGNTGNARHTLPHLHLGLYVGRRKTVDPSSYFGRE